MHRFLLSIENKQTMQETQQVEEMESQIISLSEFIPNWTYASLVGKTAMEHVKLEMELGVDISKGLRCIVGEAHEGDDYDDCDTCTFISYGDIDHGILSPAIKAYRNPEKFMKIKKELYSHMIDNHPEKMRR